MEHGLADDFLGRGQSVEDGEQAGVTQRAHALRAGDLRALGVHASNTRRAVKATTEATGLEKERRGAVKKAAPYFSAKTIGEDACAAADARVADLKLSVRQAKARYDAALRSLNEISEEVHARREAAKLDRERRLADDDAG